MQTPAGRAGAADSDNTDGGTSVSTRTAAAPQELTLRCAGWGCQGRAPTRIWEKSKAPTTPVLTPVFGWLGGDKPVLLCTDCRTAMVLNRAAKRRRRR